MANLARYLRGHGRGPKPGPWARLDYAHPMTRGLQRAYLSNAAPGVINAAGTMRNLVAAFPNGIATNTAWTPGPLPGPGALRFPTAASTYCQIGVLTPAPSAYSVAWIFNGNVAIAGVQNRKVWAMGGTSDSGGFFWDHTNAIYQQAFYHQNSGGTYFACKLATTLQLGVWYHVVGVWDGTNSLKAYLNGRLETTTTGIASLKTPAGNSYVSSRDGTTEYWDDGKIDHFFYWARALSDAEIRQLYLEPFCFIQNAAPSRPASFSAVVAAPVRKRPAVDGLTSGQRTPEPMTGGVGP